MHTIKDVAKKANVSIATVSRIVNNQSGYSEETKRKVLAAIKELNYQPNALARGLINKRTHTIGVLLPHFINAFGMELLHGIEEKAHEEGLSVIICSTDSFGAKTMKYLQVLNEKRVDGVIIIGPELEEEYYDYVKKMAVPVVLLGTEKFDNRLPSVQVDNRAIAYSAVKHLIDKGHEKIGMIAFHENGPSLRADGYRKALEDNDIIFNQERIVFSSGFAFEDGVHFFRKLMLQAPDITAAYIISDEMAVGAITAADRLGIKVPHDVSIISHDNLRVADMSIPKLTAVSLPLRRMGRTAAEKVFQMIQTGRPSESSIMQHEIVERDSVCMLAKAVKAKQPC
ncbi:LacI family DNA-binding transcriptional regulator [Mesobacillus foraminis]|uniref:LacI family DNA-binding transcriptional regulator n=1 Tax=Mesobacillus foraminis TaxID=279826 RepID=UPI00214C9793|nr:LacI family DNA-binding transcriptional regulator [Mesobacillus foraminis]